VNFRKSSERERDNRDDDESNTNTNSTRKFGAKLVDMIGFKRPMDMGESERQKYLKLKSDLSKVSNNDAINPIFCHYYVRRYTQFPI
jgi:hypothetical protein